MAGNKKLNADIDRAAAMVFVAPAVALLVAVASAVAAALFVAAAVMGLFIFGRLADGVLNQRLRRLHIGHGFGGEILRYRAGDGRHGYRRNLHRRCAPVYCFARLSRGYNKETFNALMTKFVARLHNLANHYCFSIIYT